MTSDGETPDACVDRPLASTLFRWGSQAIAIAGYGKSLITLPYPSLLLAGLAYSAALWVASGPAQGRARVLSLWAALASLLACIALSNNEALVAFAPLIPLVALVCGLRPTFAVASVVVAWSCMVSLYHQDTASGFAQIFLSMIGASVFLVEFSRLLMREREDGRAIVRQSARIAELSTVLERHRVSQAMHDGVGHYLSAAIVQLEVAHVNRSTSPEQADASIARAHELVVEGMHEVRRAVVALRERSPSSSFDTAIAELLAASEEAGIPVHLVREGTERRLAPDAAWALFSTVQEALTNVRKHSRAQRVEVYLRYLDDCVELEVADDGIGADAVEPGCGLRAIAERAASFSGSASFGPVVAGGFTVKLRIFV